jgi:cytochrome c
MQSRENDMKTQMGMPALLALWLGVAPGLQAADVPRGVHLQSPKLAPELIKTTQEETAKAIQRGEALWMDRKLGSNGQNCNMCHADGAATHPETYPKFKQQYGRVVTAQEFINWCIIGALRGPKQELGGEVLTALEAYQAFKNRGQVMEIGVPGP